MVLLHPTSLVQAALPQILEGVQPDHFKGMEEKLKAASEAAYERISKIKGIKAIKGRAAMYMMCQIERDAFKDIENDLDFCKKLLAEQNAFVFPASLFFWQDGFRMVLCTKPETLVEFGDRLEEFCLAHYKE